MGGEGGGEGEKVLSTVHVSTCRYKHGSIDFSPCLFCS